MFLALIILAAVIGSIIIAALAAYLDIHGHLVGSIIALVAGLAFITIPVVVGTKKYNEKINNIPSITYTVYKIEYYDGPSGGFKKVWLEDNGQFIWVVVEPADHIEVEEGKEITFTPKEYKALVKSTTNK